MGLSRKECERLGIAHLFPEKGSKGGGGPAHTRFVMNLTESRFAEHLEGRRLAGEIRGWAFEEDTLVLAPDMTLTPDFRVDQLDGWSDYFDVKRSKRDGGHTWEDSVVKSKAAAAIFPFHRFYLATWEADRMTAGGELRPGRWALRRLGVPRKSKGGG
jgi:hypothetical protein